MRSDPARPDVASAYRHAGRALITVFVVYGVLVAANEGEFWPFSIYPMFSQAGRPWSRALVRELPPDTPVPAWDTLAVEALPGDPYPAAPNGVDAIDLANFVSKTNTWTPSRAAALAQLLDAEGLGARRLGVYRVNGRLLPDDRVAVEAVPYAWIGRGQVDINPALAP